MDRLARLFERHRAWFGLALAGLSLLFLFGTSRLAVDDVPSSIFRSEDEAFARLEELFRDFGSDDTQCAVVLETDVVLSGEGARVLRALERELAAVPGVTAVHSLADVLVLEEPGERGGLAALVPRPLLPPEDAPPEAFARARERAAAHPLVAGRLLSDDGGATLVVASLGEANLPISTLRPRVEGVRAAAAAATAGTGMRARVTGVPAIRVVIFDAIGREQKIFSACGAAVGFLVGIAIFRRLGAVLVTSGASVLAGLWALGFMGLVGQPMNLLTTELPLLVIVIAFTDAVHLMIDALRRRQEGLPPVEAAAHAIRYLGLPCALTSLTTAVGFGSLAVSRVEVIQRFGGLFAAAVGLSFLAVICAVPYLAVRVLERTPPTSMAERFAGLHAPAERFVRWVVRHARAFSAAGIGLTLALLAVALRLVPDNRLTEAVPRGDDSVEVLRDVEARFAGLLTVAVLVEWPEGTAFPDRETLDVLAEVRGVLERSDFARAPLSVLDLLALLPGQGPPAERAGLLSLLPDELVRRFVRPDRRRALVDARIPDAGSAVAEPAYEAIEAGLAELRAAHPDHAIELTGTGYVARRNVNVMIADFAAGLALAALVIFGALTVAFRSLALGAISVVPNALPLVVAAAALVLAGQELQIASVLAFTVCLGLAVDDTIHYLSRFRRELDGAADGDVGEAAVRAFLGVGRALAVTTTVLVGGFAVLFLSTVPTSRLFAVISSIGLLTALLGDLVLLPALLVTFLRPVRSRGRP